MTLPASGQIDFSTINTEIGQSTTYSSSLSFLNGLITPGQSAGAGTGGTGVAVSNQRPSAPYALNQFYGLTYFQANIYGNCNNGNQGNCNCNCGNIQCNNCTNCNNINCANCDTQSWLQSGTNCACTYNCNVNNTSYNCNCACNCSKIVCADLYEKGLMSPTIWAADQAYGQQLRKTDKRVYRGYIRWARIVTAWMNAKGPDFMYWIENESRRKIEQQIAMTEMALKIGTPWSEHMAYLMGVLKEDNEMGRILMNIGKVICRVVSFLPVTPKSKRKHGPLTVYTIWAFLYFSYYTASTIVKIKNKLNIFKGKLNVRYN